MSTKLRIILAFIRGIAAHVYAYIYTEGFIEDTHLSGARERSFLVSMEMEIHCISFPSTIFNVNIKHVGHRPYSCVLRPLCVFLSLSLRRSKFMRFQPGREARARPNIHLTRERALNLGRLIRRIQFRMMNRSISFFLSLNAYTLLYIYTSSSPFFTEQSCRFLGKKERERERP